MITGPWQVCVRQGDTLAYKTIGTPQINISTIKRVYNFDKKCILLSMEKDGF